MDIAEAFKFIFGTFNEFISFLRSQPIIILPYGQKISVLSLLFTMTLLSILFATIAKALGILNKEVDRSTTDNNREKRNYNRSRGD